MAFNFKKALAFTLAAAMVVTAAPSANINVDAAAKKPTITASKTINAEKTASIKVNTVKKGRFIKITSISKAANVTIKAKIGKKTQKLKKNKYYKVTGKSVTLKVTGADSIADYTSTIKVSVFDKKGKKYKVVKPKNLTAKVKVKASEFSITDVVSTVDATAAGNGSKYIRATFSKAIDALDASEVEIKEKGSGQIFTVKKVTLSSNKKIADIELLGDDNAGGVAMSWLMPNTDYILTISKAGVTGQFEFSIPAVAKDSVVVAVDSKKKTIKACVAPGYAAEDTYTVPDSIKVDYEAILGTTQNIKYDKTNAIISITPIGNEKVVYGAFEAKDDDAKVATTSDNYLYDVSTKTKYYAQDAVSGNIPASKMINYGELDKKQQVLDSTVIGNLAAAKKKYAYVKLVLNGNGTIRTFMPIEKWSGNIYVSSVNGTYISSQAKEEQNLDGYAILKDGKTITTSDIKEGDVVFFQTGSKYADVYTTSKTGALEAAYDDSFKFGGEKYDIDEAFYFDASKNKKEVDAAYLKGVLAAKKDVVVFFNRAGKPVYVLGEEAVVASSDTDLVLTADGDGYQDKKDNMIELKGFNGTEIVTKTINVDKLEEVTLNGKTWKKSVGTVATTLNGVAGSFTTATENEGLSFAGGEFATLKINGKTADLCEAKLITVTADKDGNITKLVVHEPDPLAAATDTFDEFKAADKKDFKAGYKNINKSNIVASTPIYVIGKVNKTVTAKMFTYGEMTQTVKNADLEYVHVYYKKSDKENVKAVVIDNRTGKALGEDDDGSVTSEVIIKSISYLDKAVKSITVLQGTNEKTYDTFAEDIKKEFKAGNIVKITILKDGKTVKKDGIATNTADKEGAIIVNVSESKSTFDLKNGNSYDSYTIESTATIAQIDKDKNVKLISKTDLAAAAKSYKVNFSETVSGSKKVDSILVTADGNTGSTSTTVQGDDLLSVITNAAWVVSSGAKTIGLVDGFVMTNNGMTISGKAAFADAEKDQTNIQKAIDAFESNGGNFAKGSTVTAGGVSYSLDSYVVAKDTLDKAIKDAKENLIIGVSYMAQTEVATFGGNLTTGSTWFKEYIRDGLPSSVTFTMAGGEETTVNLDNGNVDTTNDIYTPVDWFVVGTKGSGVVTGAASTAIVAMGITSTGSAIQTWNKNARPAEDVAGLGVGNAVYSNPSTEWMSDLPAFWKTFEVK